MFGAADPEPPGNHLASDPASGHRASMLALYPRKAVLDLNQRPLPCQGRAPGLRPAGSWALTTVNGPLRCEVVRQCAQRLSRS